MNAVTSALDPAPPATSVPPVLVPGASVASPPMPDVTEPAAAVLDARWVASGVRTRILWPLGVGLAVLLACIVGLSIVRTNRSSEESLANAAANVKAVLQARSADQVQTMYTLAELIQAQPRVQSAFAARDRAALLASSEALFERLRARNNVTQLTFVLPDHTVLLRMDEPDRHGDPCVSKALLEAERDGKTAWRSEQVSSGSFAQRLVHPWRVGGELLGYLVLGSDFEQLAAGIRQATGADLLIVMDSSDLDVARWEAAQAARRDSLAWKAFPRAVLLASTIMQIPQAVRHYLSQPREARARSFEASAGDRLLQVLAIPYDLDTDRPADLLVLQDTTALSAERRSAVLRMTLLFAGIGGALMLFFYVFLGRVQRDVQARTTRLDEVRRSLIAAQHERQRAEQELHVEQERNQLLEARSRLVEELGEANRKAQAALLENEQVTMRLRETQVQLVAAAREAGRAEIATNVLHNVGNVLNSVNVSSGVIGATLRQSRLAGLSRGLQLLQEHGPELETYLSKDEKGRLLLPYLGAVADELGKEREGMLDELQRLTKSVEHLKDIVATQQAHASSKQVIEPVQPAELAEEALRMQGSALARHQVTVVREFEALPALPLDRGRVLQILVNLISNAKAAMAGRGDGARLTLRIERDAGTSQLRFAVRDEGEGIPPENLTRIFSHGFTTRPQGHGFGLHSCAIAAREMGGRLSVQSEGVGKGATFVLELPLAQDNAG